MFEHKLCFSLLSSCHCPAQILLFLRPVMLFLRASNFCSLKCPGFRSFSVLLWVHLSCKQNLTSSAQVSSKLHALLQLCCGLLLSFQYVFVCNGCQRNDLGGCLLSSFWVDAGSPRRSWRYIACCMGPNVIDGSMRPVSAMSRSSSRPPSATHKSQPTAQG